MTETHAHLRRPDGPFPPPRRVFITGALGFIGRALATRLQTLGCEVCGVDRRADLERDVIEGDVSRPGAWQEKMAGCDLVVHAAAIVSNASSYEQCWRLNVAGTRYALDAATAAGVQRFVHISSVRAFSDLDFPDGVNESHPVRPDGNPYVDSKVASEQVALQAHAGGEVPVTIVRPGDVYGPASRPWTVLPVAAIKQRQFLLPAMGRGVFSPVYVENLIDGLLLAAGAPQAAGQVFTLTDGVGIPCSEFFAHYCRMLGRPGPVRVPTAVAVGLARSVGAVARLRGQQSEVSATTMRYLARPGTYSIAKARRLLGFEPHVGLAEGMARTEAWLRAQGLL